MSTPAPGPAPEWWETVTIGSATESRGIMEKYLGGTLDAADPRVMDALPLLILCGGDAPAFADSIVKKTDEILATTKDISGKKDSVVRLQNWKNRLNVLWTALARVPDPYKKDADKALNAGITACTQKILQLLAGANVVRRRTRPNDP